MSIPEALGPLAGHIEERGSTAFLVTVGADDRPHVVAVTVAWRGGVLVAAAGRTTSANIEAHPDVTLVWAAPPGSGYSLIVDGKARRWPEGEGPTLALEPGRAVLHRTPEADASAPSCLAVFPAS